VLALTQSEADERAVKISSELQADPKLDGERAAALKEVLLNLVLNALQAIKRDGEVKIETTSNGANQLKITVTDTGIGVPPSMQEKIFEPFFTTKQRGTGLGLAIVARRVRELGGTITIASPVVDGRGARFVIILPSW
jgi:two-component system NtrC family sensor kinase